MKYLALFLALFTLILLTEGCTLNPVKLIKELVVGKPKKPAKEFTVNKEELTLEERKARIAWCRKNATLTAEQKVRNLLGVGATAGGAIMVIAALLLIFAKGMKKTPLIQAIIVGFVLVVISVVLEKYLIPILIVGIILIALVAGYYIYRNWAKVKKMVAFTDETIKQGHLDNDAVHAVASRTIGPQGSKDREAIKAVMNSARA